MKKQLKATKTKSIKTDFCAEQLTLYSGINPLHQFMVKEKIYDGLTSVFKKDLYNSEKFSDHHTASTVILGNLSGISHMSNYSKFSNDPLLKNLIGLDKPINEESISYKFKKLGQTGARLLEEFSLNQIKDFMSEHLTDIQTIDADSTVKTVHGNQEGAEKGFNSLHRGKKSYQPLILFYSELKTVIHSWFRTGSAYTSNGICDIIRQLQESIPEVLLNVFFRADSGFFSGELFDLLEDLGWTYLVKVKLKNLNELLAEQKWEESSSDIYVCEFEYQCKGWSKPRTFKAVRKKIGEIIVPLMDQIERIPEYKYFCYCTNLDNDPWEIHKLYGKRAESENWIDHVKNQLFAATTLTNNFWANDIFWQLSVLAYNISVMFRYRDKKAFRQEPGTFREWFIKVPGKVVSHEGYIWVKMYKDYYRKEDWLRLAKSA